VARFLTKAHFASYSGTAPVESSSSGAVVRHRLSLAGNRQLNNDALHMVAICQARSDARGRAYYRKKKKMAEGKSRKEALCGASSGASLMPSSRASRQIR
jgi:transposase